MQHHLFASCLYVTILGGLCGAARAQAVADNAEKVLTDKGLERTGVTYVLDEEKELADEIRNAARLRGQVAAASKTLGLVHQKQVAAERAVKQMFQMRSQLRKQLETSTNVKTHNRIVTQINELGDRIAVLQEGKEIKDAVRQASGAYNKVREEYMGKLLEVRKLADNLTDQYEALQADAGVRAGIEAASKASGKPLKLGPSSTLARNMKLLKSLEDRILTEKIELRRSEGDVFNVSVTFNGKFAEELTLDTGSSLVCLPWAMAERVGATPGSEAPTIRLQLADGNIIEAKQVTVGSVRVGKFTVEDVDCAVLPADLPHPASLLGQSFLSNFSYKINSDRSELIMNKVEAGP